MDFTQQQLEELIAVFRAEAIEHVKKMAEIFLSLETGSGGAKEALARAFREAHSLKGAAGSLGFGRVEALTHSLEDALGMMGREEDSVTPDSIDLMLTALDMIRVAVDETLPGDDDLTPNEVEQIQQLQDLVAREGAKESPAAADKRSPMGKEKGLQRQSLGTKGGGHELGAEQLAQLTGVFRAESIEHVKSLAEVLFSLEDGTGDAPSLLTRAFREAHSLKGSAGTLGFGRVEVVTHRLEDVLGQLSRGTKQITPKHVDVMLSALDVIRVAVEHSELGDESLTDKENEVVDALEAMASSLAEQRTEMPEDIAGKAKDGKLPTDSPEPDKKVRTAAAVEKRPQPKEKSSAPEKKEQHSTTTVRDEYIRIAESKIEGVIAQVAELFEANLQLESLNPELERFCDVASEISDMVDSLLLEFQNTGYEHDLLPITERARNLSIQLRATSKRFERDERQIGKLIQSSQEELRKIRLAPVSTIFVMIRRQVREISKITGKKLELFLGGGEYAVDRKVLDAIEEPLIHILRNAASHGIEEAEERRKANKPEAGRLSIVARHTGDAVEITVADDGRGIDTNIVRDALKKKRGMSEEQVSKMSSDQVLDHLFESGFSTLTGVSKISGRGVGLDVVKYTVERLGGEVRLESRLGEGTAICLRLPLAMSTVRCLLVRIAGRVFAIPASNVEKVIVPSVEDLKLIGGGEVITYRNQSVPLGSLNDILGLASGMTSVSEGSRIAVMISFGERRFAFGVDELVEYSTLILKPLGDLLERVPNISGISLLGTGEVALVLNPADLVRAAGGIRKEMARPIFPTLIESPETTRVLVVDDSIATRTLEKTLLESAGFTVLTASDGYKALDTLSTNRCDIVLSDVQMPNMDGFELARTIKSRSQLSHIPIILITSLGSDEDKARGLAAGADAYIVKKELTQSELVETINQLL